MLSKEQIDKILRKYIKEQLHSGYSENSIRKVMSRCKYRDEHIEELFNTHYKQQRTKKFAVASGLLLLVLFFSLPLVNQNRNQTPTGYVITKADYTEKRNFSNSAPVWNGVIDGFIISGTTTINLSQFITDKDNDNLIYNIGSVPNLNISLLNEVAVFVPENFSGDVSTVVTAYDGWNLMTKDIQLKIFGNEHGKGMMEDFQNNTEMLK